MPIVLVVVLADAEGICCLLYGAGSSDVSGLGFRSMTLSRVDGLL